MVGVIPGTRGRCRRPPSMPTVVQAAGRRRGSTCRHDRFRTANGARANRGRRRAPRRGVGDRAGSQGDDDDGGGERRGQRVRPIRHEQASGAGERECREPARSRRAHERKERERGEERVEGDWSSRSREDDDLAERTEPGRDTRHRVVSNSRRRRAEGPRPPRRAAPGSPARGAATDRGAGTRWRGSRYRAERRSRARGRAPSRRLRPLPEPQVHGAVEHPGWLQKDGREPRSTTLAPRQRPRRPTARAAPPLRGLARAGGGPVGRASFCRASSGRGARESQATTAADLPRARTERGGERVARHPLQDRRTVVPPDRPG
jgi:hypothetical protein